MELPESVPVHRYAGSVFLAATFCACALLVIDNGLALFAAGLAATTLMQWQGARHGARQPMPGLGLLARLVMFVLGTVAMSAHAHGKPLDALDNPARLLLIPWCAWLAHVTGVRREGLWSGALLGVALAFVIACRDVAMNEPRASGGGNPIVFAQLTLGLLVIVLFAAPATLPRAVRMVQMVVLSMGALVILWSGSRGTLAALVCLLAVAVLRQTVRIHVHRAGAITLLIIAVAAIVWFTPAFRSPLRLDFIGPDLQRFVSGNPDTPIGARLELLALAWQQFIAHPWQGIGLGNFGEVVQQLPGCQRVPPMGMCVLAHAHNDLAEWSATMGVPGLLAILCVYAVPMTMFAAIIRTCADEAARRAAWTGAMLIMAYAICGLSQSMFSHAATASAYAVITGTLLGIAMRPVRCAT